MSELNCINSIDLLSNSQLLLYTRVGEISYIDDILKLLNNCNTNNHIKLTTLACTIKKIEFEKCTIELYHRLPCE